MYISVLRWDFYDETLKLYGCEMWEVCLYLICADEVYLHKLTASAVFAYAHEKHGELRNLLRSLQTRSM